VVEAVGPTSVHARSITDRLALAVATVGGVGYSPLVPGTAGSLIAVAILWLVPFSRLGLIAYFIIVTLVGVWAAHRAEGLLGGKDPGAIVVDEVAGMTLSVLGLPLTPAVLAVAFVLFRVFDVVKPPPARGSQSLRGGVGVMVDDLIAGLYALAVVGVVRGVFRWP
jgi:phosphatidylglycerophosphatase A